MVNHHFSIFCIIFLSTLLAQLSIIKNTDRTPSAYFKTSLYTSLLVKFSLKYCPFLWHRYFKSKLKTLAKHLGIVHLNRAHKSPAPPECCCQLWHCSISVTPSLHFKIKLSVSILTKSSFKHASYSLQIVNRCFLKCSTLLGHTNPLKLYTDKVKD